MRSNRTPRIDTSVSVLAVPLHHLLSLLNPSLLYLFMWVLQLPLSNTHPLAPCTQAHMKEPFSHSPDQHVIPSCCSQQPAAGIPRKLHNLRSNQRQSRQGMHFDLSADHSNKQHAGMSCMPHEVLVSCSRQRQRLAMFAFCLHHAGQAMPLPLLWAPVSDAACGAHAVHVTESQVPDILAA